MSINKILTILNIAGLLGAIYWLYKEQTMEPLVTTIGLIASLIALIYNKTKSESKKVIMKQKGGKGSKNYQSKGDININNNNK